MDLFCTYKYPGTCSGQVIVAAWRNTSSYLRYLEERIDILGRI